MRFTGKVFDGKKLAKLSVGCMRFDSCEEAKKIIHECVENEAIYLDTAPLYCYRSEEENTETWVGRAIKGIRDKVILSAKCSTGNGGTGIGEFNLKHGFSVVTKDQFKMQFEQSLRRLDVSNFDCYQFWAAHSPEIYAEAKKKGGWLEGALEMKEKGYFKHLGITTHGGNDMIKEMVDDGIYEMITVPFHIMDTSRLEGIEYAAKHNVAVIAMNPLAGGMLAGKSDKIKDVMKDFGIQSSEDMALKFVTAFDGVSALAGMSVVEHAKKNIQIINNEPLTKEQALAMQKRFSDLIKNDKKLCTSCGYCKPCPQGLNVGDILRIRNYYKILGLESALHQLRDMHHWNGGATHDISKCTNCKNCESKCPNQISVTELFAEIRDMIESVS